MSIITTVPIQNNRIKQLIQQMESTSIITFHQSCLELMSKGFSMNRHVVDFLLQKLVMWKSSNGVLGIAFLVFQLTL
uniref:Uncharacterized protein n=1 Tax=Acrobeloides nanus TaxID=290746 RepID=A0A914DSH2_9BILA